MVVLAAQIVRGDIVEEMVMCQRLVVKQGDEDGVRVNELGGDERISKVIDYHRFLVDPDNAVDLKFLSFLGILTPWINPESSQIELAVVKVGNSVQVTFL